MRAKIIQYNSTEGKGIALTDGIQYDFSIRQWRSETAPTTGQTIDITLEGSAVAAVFLVGKDVLAKEMASRLGSSVSSSAQSLGATSASVANPIQMFGPGILASYAIYLIALLFLDAVSISVLGMSNGVSLWSALSAFSSGGAGITKLLIILAILAPVVPMVWRNPLAWLALAVPVLPYMATYLLSQAQLSSTASSDTMGFGRMMASMAKEAISVGIGSYIGVAAALCLGALGVRRYLAESSSISPAKPIQAVMPQSVSVEVATPNTACPKCGGSLAPNAKFCGHCGHAIG